MNLLPTGEKANIDVAISELLEGGFVYVIDSIDWRFFRRLIEHNLCPEDLLNAAWEEGRYFALIDATQEGCGYILTVVGEEPKAFWGPLNALSAAEARGSSSTTTT